MIPKKKYRDKVRGRLQLVQDLLLSNPERVKEMMRRVGGFGEGSDLHNKLEVLKMLLETDVPALLNAFDQLARPDTGTEGT